MSRRKKRKSAIPALLAVLCLCGAGVLGYLGYSELDERKSGNDFYAELAAQNVTEAPGDAGAPNADAQPDPLPSVAEEEAAPQRDIAREILQQRVAREEEGLTYDDVEGEDEPTPDDDEPVEAAQPRAGAAEPSGEGRDRDGAADLADGDAAVPGADADGQAPDAGVSDETSPTANAQAGQSAPVNDAQVGGSAPEAAAPNGDSAATGEAAQGDSPAPVPGSGEAEGAQPAGGDSSEGTSGGANSADDQAAGGDSAEGTSDGANPAAEQAARGDIPPSDDADAGASGPQDAAGPRKDGADAEDAQSAPLVEVTPPGGVLDDIPGETIEEKIEKLLAAVEIRESAMDFAALRETLPDCVGWVRIQDTVIDYPVVQGTDNHFYLHHLANKAANSNGAIMMGVANNPIWLDMLTTLHGHHMRSGAMFGKLNAYNDIAYFARHPVVEIYTPLGDFEGQIFAACVVDPKRYAYPIYLTQDDFAVVMQEVIGNSPYHVANVTIDGETLIEATDRTVTVDGEKGGEPEVLQLPEVDLAYGDRIVVLSTCEYTFYNARYLVLAKLVPATLRYGEP